MTIVLTSEMVGGALRAGHTTRSEMLIKAGFHVGQRVRTRNLHARGHTRLARYLRGKVGTVEVDLGVFTLPDTMAHGSIPTPQHVYTISFTAQELWGPSADPRDTIRAGLWEDYLDLDNDALR